MKKLKAQVDQKSQKNGTDGSWSAESELLENGNDPNIIELHRKKAQQSRFFLQFNHFACLFLQEIPAGK